jgi:hypothetical protein
MSRLKNPRGKPAGGAVGQEKGWGRCGLVDVGRELRVTGGAPDRCTDLHALPATGDPPPASQAGVFQGNP